MNTYLDRWVAATAILFMCLIGVFSAPSFADDAEIRTTSEIYVSAHTRNIVDTTDHLQLSVPLWHHSNDAYDSHSEKTGTAVIRLALHPLKAANFTNGWSVKPSLAKSIALELRRIDGATVHAELPNNLLAQALDPQITSVRVYQLSDETTGQISGFEMALPFGTKEDRFACYDLLEENGALSDYQRGSVYTNVAQGSEVDPLLRAKVYFNGTHSFSIWHPKECNEIFGARAP